jgi:dihydrolipoamide dehydrogenase
LWLREEFQIQIPDLEKTRVRVNKKGYIITDEYLETGVKGIFALGDAIGRYLFKHNANHEAQYAIHNIMHPDRKIPVNCCHATCDI